MRSQRDKEQQGTQLDGDYWRLTLSGWDEGRRWKPLKCGEKKENLINSHSGPQNSFLKTWTPKDLIHLFSQIHHLLNIRTIVRPVWKMWGIRHLHMLLTGKLRTDGGLINCVACCMNDLFNQTDDLKLTRGFLPLLVYICVFDRWVCVNASHYPESPPGVDTHHWRIPDSRRRDNLIRIVDRHRECKNTEATAQCMIACKMLQTLK